MTVEKRFALIKNAGGGGTPGPNSVTNAMLAQAPAISVKANPTNATANEQDFAASGGNQVLQTNAAGTALTWGPFGTGVQVRGATWCGGNVALVAGNMTDVSIIVPTDSQITRCTILTKGGTGSCQVDIWTSPVASYPPTVANSICTVKPTISSGNNYDDGVLSGFSTVHIPTGNVVTFHLVSSSVFTEITVMLALTPTQTLTATGYTDAQAVAAVKAAMTNAGNVVASGGTGAITLNDSSASGTYGQSFAANGWQRLPSGLYLQWGNFPAPASGAVSVSFPTTFPNNCWSVVCSQGQSTSYGYPFSIASKSTTGFVTDAAAAGGILAGTCYYFAIGN